MGFDTGTRWARIARTADGTENAEDAIPNAALIARSGGLKAVIELAPGLWSAVGFAASNMHMVEAAGTVTIIDTTESTG